MTLQIVTGGAGFIGSHLTRGLLAEGHAVRVIDNFSTGRRENLAGLAAQHPGRLEVVEGSITDVELNRRVFAGADAVFHQAALPSVPKSIEDPLRCNLHNIDGTLAVLVAARDTGVRRVVYAASSSAYGDTPTLPKVETMPAQPLSPYALTKFAGEEYARIFHQIYGLETVSLRYFNIFGPRQDPASQYAAVIPRFITRMLRGEPPIIYGDGGQSRDFTYIDNVVRANQLAAAAPATACGQVYNVACGERIDLNELASQLAVILGTESRPIHEPGRPGDVRHSLADIRLAGERLGYRPHVSVAEGLRRTVDWYRQAGNPAGV